MKKEEILVGILLLVGILGLVIAGEWEVKDDSPIVDEVQKEIPKEVASVKIETVEKVEAPFSDWQKYNIDYMNDNIKAILVKKLGTNGKTAFYLPPTGYMNVSMGTKYGVAFAIQNVNPKVPEGNLFAYDFKADPLSIDDCGVSVSEAQSWIERGWASSGMISGQWREDWNDWYDAMTVYFSFPLDIKSCNVKYNFVITRDGAAYDSRILEFNLV